MVACLGSHFYGPAVRSERSLISLIGDQCSPGATRPRRKPGMRASSLESVEWRNHGTEHNQASWMGVLGRRPTLGLWFFSRDSLHHEAWRIPQPTLSSWQYVIVDPASSVPLLVFVQVPHALVGAVMYAGIPMGTDCSPAAILSTSIDNSSLCKSPSSRY